MFLRRKVYLPALAFAVLFLAGCPKANQDFEAGRKAEAIQDYDTALVHYERAYRTDPSNSEYKLRATKMRMEDGQFHRRGRRKSPELRAICSWRWANSRRPRRSIPPTPRPNKKSRRRWSMMAAKSAADARRQSESQSRTGCRPAAGAAGTQAHVDSSPSTSR